MSLSGLRALGFDYESFLELVVQVRLYSYVSGRLLPSLEKRPQQSLTKLLAAALDFTMSNRSIPSVCPLLVNVLEE